MAGSVWDEVLDCEHVVVVRTYVERWPRKDRAPEKVLIIVVEPDGSTSACARGAGAAASPWSATCGGGGHWTCTASGASWNRRCRGSTAPSTARSPPRCRAASLWLAGSVVSGAAGVECRALCWVRSGRACRADFQTWRLRVCRAGGSVRRVAVRLRIALRRGRRLSGTAR
jgi:hypothetical protein